MENNSKVGDVRVIRQQIISLALNQELSKEEKKPQAKALFEQMRIVYKSIKGKDIMELEEYKKFFLEQFGNDFFDESKETQEERD